MRKYIAVIVKRVVRFAKAIQNLIDCHDLTLSNLAMTMGGLCNLPNLAMTMGGLCNLSNLARRSFFSNDKVNLL